MWGNNCQIMTWRSGLSTGSPASRSLTSPLSAALYVENCELIREAVRILWKTLGEPHLDLKNSSREKTSVTRDDVLVSSMRELVEVFELKNAGTPDNRPRSLKDLYQASRGSETYQELKELRAFVAALENGYILCKYINKVQSRRVTSPLTPSLCGSVDACLENLEQFLSACVAYKIQEDDLFEPGDLTIADNESLGRVATTIIALSKRKKMRSRSFASANDEPDSFIPVVRGAPLRHRARDLQPPWPPQARSQDDTKPLETYSHQTVSRSSPQLCPDQTVVTLFSTILRDKNMYRDFLDLQGDLAQASLDTLQQIIDDEGTTKILKNTFATALLRLSLKSSLYPSRLVLKGVEREPFACANGNFGDVYKGTFRDRPVCIKVVKLYKNSQVDHALKAFSREAIVWSRAKHPNVLPFYGIYQLDEQYRRLCLVSPWMDNGNMREYLDANPQTNRVSLARDVARGLRYLHDRNIIHGDLKGPNILVTPYGQACLGDFGLSCISDPNVLQWTSVESSAHCGGTVRWKAPELIDPDKDDGASKASDIYAFACVCYEIFTGAVPFHEVLRDYAVILLIMGGKRPSKPADTSEAFAQRGLNTVIWNLMEACWSPDAGQRPTAKDVLRRLPRSLRRPTTVMEAEDEVLTRTIFRAGMPSEKQEIPRELVDVLRKICTS